MSKSTMLIETFRAERLRQREALRGAGEPATAGPVRADDPVQAPEPASLAIDPASAPMACTCGGAAGGAEHTTGRADAPMAEIGIGPAMTMRLGQLGVHSTRDLAQADPGTLGVLLGDISRLLDLEAWIAAARRTQLPRA